MNTLSVTQDAQESSPADAPSDPPASVQTLLTEIEALHKLLLKDAEDGRGETAQAQRDPSYSRTVWTWWGTGVCLLLLRIPLGSAWVTLALALIALVLISICIWTGGRSIIREWKDRRADTLRQLHVGFSRERPLLEALLPYSRAALLHVAASARAADNRVWSRISFFLGPNRSGGLLGALLLIFGIFSAGKYLQDQGVTLPLLGTKIILGTKITVDHILMVGGGLWTAALALLFAGASVHSLNSTADLLERAAALKKNLAEDQKEEGR